VSAECDGVLERIYSALDGEVSASELADIHHHLEACPPCLEEYEVEAALKALVRRCCAEQAPAALRAKIVASITRVQTVQTTVTAHASDGSAVVTRVTRTTTVEG
jgi:mycothiol system anti-sigma-R factor